MKILLTGGAGYIGSHTYVSLIHHGFTPIILDNFSNSHPNVLNRLSKITGKLTLCEEGDVRDAAFVNNVMEKHQTAAVIHFAALKSVEQSCRDPLLYYRHNNDALSALLEAMQKVECHELVYSSSATVYGEPKKLPIDETTELHHTNPYGHTKIIGEAMLHYLQRANPTFAYACLRYFNPVGAHTSGLIGEDPKGIPSNLMPFICQVATGRRPSLNIFGKDYNTIDGTGVRDYIHVMDLAEGHVVALKYLLANSKSFTVNLGTGQGHSVLEIVRTFEKVSGVKIKTHYVEKRAGDVAACYADVTLAKTLLNWHATRNLDDMCHDAWRWQSNNPEGYKN